MLSLEDIVKLAGPKPNYALTIPKIESTLLIANEF
jgi:hypothetical protein